jgi:lipopolysaccharide/colanic/teichoic acid biosynthesis glycosyltransferase
VGRFLRYTSLDELVQLVNIYRGEMSVVGPRPVLPHHFNRYTDDQKRRFEIRPGITGLAQVNGRNLLPWTRRLEYDLEYIQNYSFSLDLKILFQTFRVVLLREGMVLDRNPNQVDDLGQS